MVSPAITAAEARRVVAQVRDPEIPVLTIEDLGILRDVSVEGASVTVTITPTYSGCPALSMITADIQAALRDNGVDSATVRTVLSPAWTTDWMTDAARQRIADYGIAPPQARAAGLLQVGIRCPHCGSVSTRERSHFGATACLAQYVCTGCREPFDHFKNY
jgi:ring-1,2-phenylacetyl-CoA epoxidase subunit PaaD